MYRLDNFYQSKPWRKLLEQIKIDRLTPDGEIICEYCNKPITRAYDIIGHHKTELTEENVNDYNISLNPDNVALVHARCHNYIHDKLGYSRRQVYLVYGSPMAGKSSYVRNAMSKGDLVIDMDNLWQAVSNCDRYDKPNRLKAVVFKLRDTLLDSVKYRLGKWNNAYIIGGYPLQSERDRLTTELGARQIFIDTSKEECLARLAADSSRDSGEWTRYINDWWNNYSRDLSATTYSDDAPL